MHDPMVVVDPCLPARGAIAIGVRQSRFAELGSVTLQNRCRKFVVHAVVSDHIPLEGTIEDVLSRPTHHALTVDHPPLVAHIHYGGADAYYYQLNADEYGRLTSVSIEIVCKLPVVAFWMARTCIGHVLDQMMLHLAPSGRRVWLPLLIQRMELHLEGDFVPLAYQFVVPYEEGLRYGSLGGIQYRLDLAPYLSLIRETISATSPYYRLICAFRLFEGVLKGFRGFIKKKALEHSIDETVPRPAKVDKSFLRELGCSEEIIAKASNTEKLANELRELRNKVAHFFLDDSGGVGVDLSNGRFHFDVSRAASLMLHYAHADFDALLRFYQRNVAVKDDIGQVGPMVEQRERFTLRAEGCF